MTQHRVIKVDRDDTLTGAMVFSNSLQITGKLIPATGSVSLGSSSEATYVAVYDSAGSVLGYLKVFPWRTYIPSAASGASCAGSAVVS